MTARDRRVLNALLIRWYVPICAAWLNALR
jgi:hypothetical protein